MNLEEYIRQSYTRPNRQVLESFGASEELIEYLLKTPWNTNLSIISSIGESGEEEEVIFYYAEDSEYSEEYQSYKLKADAISENEAYFYGEVNGLKFIATVEYIPGYFPQNDYEMETWPEVILKGATYESTGEEVSEDVIVKIEIKLADYSPDFIKACIGEPQE